MVPGLELYSLDQMQAKKRPMPVLMVRIAVHSKIRIYTQNALGG